MGVIPSLLDPYVPGPGLHGFLTLVRLYNFFFQTLIFNLTAALKSPGERRRKCGQQQTYTDGQRQPWLHRRPRPKQLSARRSNPTKSMYAPLGMMCQGTVWLMRFSRYRENIESSPARSSN